MVQRWRYQHRCYPSLPYPFQDFQWLTHPKNFTILTCFRLYKEISNNNISNNSSSNSNINRRLQLRTK